MANQLSALLEVWFPERDSAQWVLGTVYKTEGPCYRKAGAMMLFNSAGQQFGMLSGGCLESDIQIHARKVMHSGQPLTLSYDGSDEDDLSFELGIGCGGKVYILLQPVTPQNQYLQLPAVRECLQQRLQGVFYQRIPATMSADEPEQGDELARFSKISERSGVAESPELASIDGDSWLVTPVVPDPHLLVIGGGIDARPLVSMAKQLGWVVSVWDPRPANARRDYFIDAEYLLNGPADSLPDHVKAAVVSAAVVMSHNVALDAAALAALNGFGLKYLALLGPANRKAQVLAAAQLDEATLAQPLYGPAGFDIGGELPESIALSILSQCHHALFKADCSESDCLE